MGHCRAGAVSVRMDCQVLGRPTIWPAPGRCFPQPLNPMNVSIDTLLHQKSGDVFSVPSTVTVAEAVGEMNSRKVGAVLVMDGERLAGIFTERDVLRRVV